MACRPDVGSDHQRAESLRQLQATVVGIAGNRRLAAHGHDETARRDDGAPSARAGIAFRRAIEDYLKRERPAVEQEIEGLKQYSPFRKENE